MSVCTYRRREHQQHPTKLVFVRGSPDVTKRDVWLARQRRHTRTHRVKIEKIHYQQLMHVQQKRKHGKEEHVQGKRRWDGTLGRAR